jgi:LmbE family N-acetylglucosaminyl deacetylase
MAAESPTDPQSRLVGTDSPARPALEPARLIVPINSEKQIKRLAVLQSEIAWLGEESLRNAVPTKKPKVRGSKAPGTIIRKPAGRYRMPRQVKKQLIDRFINNDAGQGERPRIMIVAAHQDDESVGAGARLCFLSDAWVVHVTDGAPADESVAKRYGFNSREEYALARRQELTAALDVAGVLPEHRLCLNYVDGEASFQMVDLVLRLADLIDSIGPQVIITHAYEGGHTDHDATAFAVHLACGLLRREGAAPPAVLEMTSYFRRDSRRIVHDFLPHARADLDRREIKLSEELQAKKNQMYKCFVSQQRVIQTFTTEIEKFRPAPRYVFTVPPHEGELNYERFGDPHRGERWRRHAQDALATLRLRKTA